MMLDADADAEAAIVCAGNMNIEDEGDVSAEIDAASVPPPRHAEDKVIVSIR